MGVHKPDGTLTWILVNSEPLLRAGEATPYAVASSFTDITELKRVEAQLRHSALHDDLTSLPTRALLHDRLERALAYTKRDPAFRFAVLYIDLDGFKAVNDTLGHSVGDNLLVTIARRLESCVRGSDTVARLSGDEFAVLLEHLTYAGDARQLAERMLRDLTISLNMAGHKVSVSASIGIVLSGMYLHLHVICCTLPTPRCTRRKRQAKRSTGSLVDPRLTEGCAGAAVRVADGACAVADCP